MGSFENDLNLEATELRLGLPGTEESSDKSNGSRSSSNKRPLSDSETKQDGEDERPKAASSKYVLSIVSLSAVLGMRLETIREILYEFQLILSIFVLVGLILSIVDRAQIVGWPPIGSYRKISLQLKKAEPEAAASGIYVKVSMDGAPYLRKIDLKVYNGYPMLLKALENMFKFTAGEDQHQFKASLVDWSICSVSWNQSWSVDFQVSTRRGKATKGRITPRHTRTKTVT